MYTYIYAFALYRSQVFCPKNQELAQLLLDKKLIAKVRFF